MGEIVIEDEKMTIGIDEPITPMPWKKLIGAYVLLLCEAISTTSFFTYISPYIVFLGVTDDKSKVGFYAGFVGSSFSLAQFISSYFWGIASDKAGRKPILILGSIGSMISLIGVGSSTSLVMLILSRSICGLLNGNIGVIKTFIGEVTDKTNQIEAFGLIGLCWGLGAVIGPVLGGLLADPVTQYPSIFGNSTLFTHHPYLLPNLVIAAITAFGCLFTFIYMKETLNKKKKKLSRSKSRSISLSNLSQSKSTMDLIEQQEDSLSPSPTQDNIFTQFNENTLKESCELVIESNSVLTISQNIYDNQNDKLIEKNREIEKKKKRIEKERKRIEREENGEDIKEITLGDDSNIFKKCFLKIKSFFEKDDQEENTNIFRDKLIMKTTLLYGMVGFIFTMFDETFPLWAFMEKDQGGLNMESRTVGFSGMISGTSIVFVQFVLIKRVTRKIGILKTFTLGTVIAVFSFVSFPPLTLVAPTETSSTFQHAVFWILLSIILLIRNICAQFIFTPVIAFINNSCKVAVRGSANGFGQSLVALTRTLGPLTGAPLLSWSSNSGYPFPLNFAFVFLLMSLLSFIPMGVSWFLLPKSLVAPIDESNDVDESENENETETETQNGDYSDNEFETANGDIETENGDNIENENRSDYIVDLGKDSSLDVYTDPGLDEKKLPLV